MAEIPVEECGDLAKRMKLPSSVGPDNRQNLLRHRRIVGDNAVLIQ
jgi:hypothetical protein